MDSSVDFPQPEGPEIATYSPRSMERWIPASAWVSTSSVKKTFLRSSSWISASPLVLMSLLAFS